MTTPTEPNKAAAPGGILPGMAMIAIFVLFVGMLTAFGALSGKYPGGARYVVLTVSTLMVLGVFGLLRLRRWGWALVSAGCLFMSMWNVYMERLMHVPGIFVMAGLYLVFFLYMVRPEVRERLH